MPENDDRRAATFGENHRWLAADVDRDHSELNLNISDYDEWLGVTTLTRKEALALRDFITANFE